MAEYRTLQLDVEGRPSQVLSWEDAVCLYYKGKAIILEEYDEIICSPSTAMYVPAVIQLRTTSRNNKKAIRFSRANVYTRDKYTCLYCGVKFPAKQLTYDHVVPRRAGGKTTFENIATSCKPCNERKGGRTPAQAGMRLLHVPAKPRSLPLHTVILVPFEVPEPWKPYLNGMEVHAPNHYVSIG